MRKLLYGEKAAPYQTYTWTVSIKNIAPTYTRIWLYMKPLESLITFRENRS